MRKRQLRHHVLKYSYARWALVAALLLLLLPQSVIAKTHSDTSKRRSKSVPSWLSVPTNHPKHSQSEELYFQGRELMEKGSYGRAIGIFTRYIAMHKEESKRIKNENKTTRDYYLSWGPQNRAWCYIQLKNYGKAIDDLTDAIKLRPTYALNYKNRAQCYQLTQRLDLAKNDLAAARNLPGENSDDDDLNAFFRFSPIKRH